MAFGIYLRGMALSLEEPHLNTAGERVMKLYVFRQFVSEWGGMMCAVANSQQEAILLLRDKDDLLAHTMPLDEDLGQCEVFEIENGLSFSEWCGH